MSTAGDPLPVEAPRVRGGKIVGGLALGLVLTFLVSVYTFSALVMRSTPAPWVLLAPIFSLPLLGLVVLIVPRWRRAGAGLMMGLAIGSVIVGGVCSAMYGSEYQVQQMDRDGPRP